MIKNFFLDGLVLAGLFLLTMNDFSNKNGVNNVDTDMEQIKPFVVLELFTSQGCSSCPRADELLEKTKNKYPDKVFALSYHVDYWNYIGWEDPFSNESFVKKQSFYNIKFKNRSNYTPQLVVNGKEHFVGSDTRKLDVSLKNHLSAEPKNNVEIVGLKKSKGTITFDYELNVDNRSSNLRAILALDNRTTEVMRGENRSRTLSNSNIVIAEKYIERENHKGTASFEIPEIVKENEKVHLILLIENENKDITGATKAEIPH